MLHSLFNLINVRSNFYTCITEAFDQPSPRPTGVSWTPTLSGGRPTATPMTAAAAGGARAGSITATATFATARGLGRGHRGEATTSRPRATGAAARRAERGGAAGSGHRRARPRSTPRRRTRPPPRRARSTDTGTDGLQPLSRYKISLTRHSGFLS